MTDDHDLLDMCERFYTAVDAILRGDSAPMIAVWRHGEEVSYCDTRGEIVVGWPALEAYWRQAAALNATAPRRLSATGRIKHAVVVGDLAYVIALEEVRHEGEPGAMGARALLRRSFYAREWRRMRIQARMTTAPRARRWASGAVLGLTVIAGGGNLTPWPLLSARRGGVECVC